MPPSDGYNEFLPASQPRAQTIANEASQINYSCFECGLNAHIGTGTTCGALRPFMNVGIPLGHCSNEGRSRFFDLNPADAKICGGCVASIRNHMSYEYAAE